MGDGPGEVSIVLQFSYQRDLAAHLIAWFGHGAGFSHVDAVDGDGRLWGARSDICMGVAPGVQIRPAAYADFARILRVELPPAPGMAELFWAGMRAELGKPYDMRAILGFGTGRDWREPGHWFCSEYIGDKLEFCAFFDHPLATPADKLDPDDLLLALSARVPIFVPAPSCLGAS